MNTYYHDKDAGTYLTVNNPTESERVEAELDRILMQRFLPVLLGYL